MTPKPLTLLATFAVTLACAVGAVLGCNESSSSGPGGAPTTTATSQPAHHNVGLDINSLNEIGSTVAEEGLVQWAKTAADTPTTQDAGTAETVVGIVGPGPLAIALGTIQYAPAGALTASDTNNAVFKVFKRNAPDGGGGTTQTLLGTASTFTPGLDGGTGNWFPWTPVTFTLVAGAYVSPADVITISITKNGTTGVSVPQGELNLYTTIR